jgi:hypothetical protein
MYLGMHQALVAHGIVPDVVLGSCGGAIAATLLHLLADPKDQLEWLSSPAVYHYWQGFTTGPHASVYQATRGAIARYFNAPTPSDAYTLSQEYLFEIPAQTLPWPDPKNAHTPDIVTMGARYLPTQNDPPQPPQPTQPTQPTQQPAPPAPQWQETAFCHAPKALQLLNNAPAAMVGGRYPASRIQPTIAARDDAPLTVLADISVRDMYYFQPRQWSGNMFIGGAINLIPIELAHRLAHRVVIETKAQANPFLLAPAWRNVWGVDAHTRIQAANAHPAHLRIDTRNFQQAIDKPLLTQRIDWLRRELRLRAPPTHRAYVQALRQQWDYGYAQTRTAIKGTL